MAAATLALAGCQQVSGPATPEEIALGASIEQARAHLAASLGNARAGRWDLAAAHAGHPAETMQAIASALSKHDAKADATLRQRIGEIVQAAQARDAATLGSLVADADARLATVAASVMGADRAAEISYRASVVATLAETAAEEYGEGIEGGALRNELEYQDAYVFFQRAVAIWADVGPEIAASHPDEHAKIGAAVSTLRAALPSLEPPSAPVPAETVASLARTVHEELREAVGARTGVAAASANELATGAALQSASAHLDAGVAALERGDADVANSEILAFRNAWPGVEGTVKARSTEAYRTIENDTAAALSNLAQRPADVAAARAAVERIRTALGPFVAAPATYGAFDAAIILLREGLEALLVVAALLAFLIKSGNDDKRGWIWAGGGAGVLASVGVALLVNVAFSASAGAGVNPEIIEGVTGLFAAAMLVYVSYWMHSKASLASWERYIRDKTSAALARNSLLSLALIAFLAVFREGAETVLFYLGIAPSIALGDLVFGLATGIAGLAALGVAMLVLGVRIPIRPFFLVASLLHLLPSVQVRRLGHSRPPGRRPRPGDPERDPSGRRPHRYVPDVGDDGVPSDPARRCDRARPLRARARRARNGGRRGLTRAARRVPRVSH